MKKDKAMKWVEALRSGKYKQGRQYLRKNNQYCCLGVLAEISGAVFIVDEKDLGRLELSEKCGINSSEGSFINSDGKYCTLANLNDIRCTFEEIANIIEKEYKQL